MAKQVITPGTVAKDEASLKTAFDQINSNFTEVYNSINSGSSNYTVTESDVTQHQAALSITESQISDLSHYNNTDVDAHLNTSTASSGEVLSWTGTDYDWVTPSSSGGSSGSGSETVLTTQATSLDQVVDLYGYKSAKISGYWRESTTMSPSFGFYRDAATSLTASNGWGIYSRSPSSGWTQTIYNPPTTNYLYMGMNTDSSQGWFEIIIDGIGTNKLIFNTHTKTNYSPLADNWWTGVYSTDTLDCRYFKFQSPQSQIYRYVTIIGYQ